MLMRLTKAAAIAALLLLTPVGGPILLSTPVHAADCKWTAAEEEDEGGPVLTASVCASKATGAPELLLQCLGAPTLSYDLGQNGASTEEGAKGTFTFKVGGKDIAKELQLESMYNYFVVTLDKSDELLALMASGSELKITSSNYGSNTFTLAGAKAAIHKVLAKCK